MPHDENPYTEPARAEGKHRFMAGTCVDCGHPLDPICKANIDLDGKGIKRAAMTDDRKTAQPTEPLDTRIPCPFCGVKGCMGFGCLPEPSGVPHSSAEAKEEEVMTDDSKPMTFEEWWHAVGCKLIYETRADRVAIVKAVQAQTWAMAQLVEREQQEPGVPHSSASLPPLDVTDGDRVEAKREWGGNSGWGETAKLLCRERQLTEALRREKELEEKVEARWQRLWL